MEQASTNSEGSTQRKHERWPHLPAAPWRYLGHTREVFQAVPGDPNCPIQPGASCDHCGTAIYETHRFCAADGRVFKVGSTCVSKMLAEQRTNSLAAAERAIKAQRREQARERAANKRAVDYETLTALLADETVRAALASKPHPLPFKASEGETLLDWAAWMHENGGGRAHANVIRVIREVAS